MRIAVVGDLHGHWLELRNVLEELHAHSPIDLVLQVGDAQATRDDVDLSFMPVPEKYRRLGTFQQLAVPWPIPTWFIGGNHEPFNRLESMPMGGEMLENLHYMGRATSRTFGALRIAGLSGVFSSRFYDSPREARPFSTSKAKQAAYFRRKEVQELSRTPRPDILLLHEWPAQMESARDPAWPRHLTKVGCEALGELVLNLRPKFVFCGHLHLSASTQLGETTIIALNNFSALPDRAIALLEWTGDELRLIEMI